MCAVPHRARQSRVTLHEHYARSQRRQLAERCSARPKRDPTRRVRRSHELPALPQASELSALGGCRPPRRTVGLLHQKDARVMLERLRPTSHILDRACGAAPPRSGPRAPAAPCKGSAQLCAPSRRNSQPPLGFASAHSGATPTAVLGHRGLHCAAVSQGGEAGQGHRRWHGHGPRGRGLCVCLAPRQNSTGFRSAHAGCGFSRECSEPVGGV